MFELVLLFYVVGMSVTVRRIYIYILLYI